MRYSVTRVFGIGAASVVFFPIVVAPGSPEPAVPAPHRAAVLGHAACENCHGPGEHYLEPRTADAALLGLQQEVIALAPEALRQPPSEGR